MTAPTKRRLTIAAVIAGAGIAIATASGVAFAATESAEPIWATVVDGSGAPEPSVAADDGTGVAADRGTDCPDGSGSGSAGSNQQNESGGDL